MPVDDDVCSARAVIPTLLDDVVRGALDPAYLDAAAARTQPRRRRARPVSWLVLLVAGVLVAAAVHRQSVAAPEQSRTRAALVADVEAQTAANASLADRIDGLNQTNAELRTQELSTSTEGATLTSQIDSLEPVVGQRAVVGPGVRVTLADPPSDPDGEPGVGSGGGRYPGQLPPAARLQDADVAEVVNLLWAAGAEAVSVSGVRLTATTAIRAAGEAVLVGFRPVLSPYLIEAVGDPVGLENAMNTAAVSSRLRGLAAAYGGEFSVSPAGEVTLPAAPVTTPRRAGGLVSVVPS